MDGVDGERTHDKIRVLLGLLSNDVVQMSLSDGNSLLLKGCFASRGSGRSLIHSWRIGRLLACYLVGHSREKCPGSPRAKHPPVGLRTEGLLNAGLVLGTPLGRGAVGRGVKLGRGANECGLDGG